MFRVIQKETIFLVSNDSPGKQKIEIKKYTFIIK